MGSYREFAPSPPLHALIACRWLREPPQDDGSDATLILPDGCVDLIWRDGGLLVVGLDSAARRSPVKPGEAIAGVRLRPGVAGAVFGMPASELLDVQVPLEDVVGPEADEFSERLAAAPGHDTEHLLLKGLVAAAIADRSPHPLVLAATRRLGFSGSRV